MNTIKIMLPEMPLKQSVQLNLVAPDLVTLHIQQISSTFTKKKKKQKTIALSVSNESFHLFTLGQVGMLYIIKYY